jgi:1,4-alpha-glucan branching enzyme
LNSGNLCLILHAHLPFIRHPEYESFFEERWLFEAISEVYIPLLDVFEKLISEKRDFRLTMSITPPLMSMLADPLLQDRYIKYAELQLELSRKELLRTEGQPEYNRLARLYEKNCRNALNKFKKRYCRDLVKAFKDMQDAGYLEIIACAATHGYLPLLGMNEESVYAQITTGVQCYEKFLGRKPRGIWLPECGYFPGVEAPLKQSGIEYFIMETHGVRFAEPRPVFGVYSPIVSPNGLAAFGRDPESSRQVWSSHEGYPGDYDYRDYYRDIGFDLDYDYIRNYISPDGQRSATGIKYHRITGKTDEKLPYDNNKARRKASLHAADFIRKKQLQTDKLSLVMDRTPIIVCPYDAELFGHWWYEGPHWLYCLLKDEVFNTSLKLVTPSEYLDANPVMQVSSPCASSWGHAGYNDVWLNKSNDWIYRLLSKAAESMVRLAGSFTDPDGILKDALNQAARELLLAQSSDWAFIMRAGTLTDYAKTRTQKHIDNFERICKHINEGTLDKEKLWLAELMDRDNIFPDIDYRVFCKKM